MTSHRIQHGGADELDMAPEYGTLLAHLGDGFSRVQFDSGEIATVLTCDVHDPINYAA